MSPLICARAHSLVRVAPLLLHPPPEDESPLKVHPRYFLLGLAPNFFLSMYPPECFPPE